MKWKQFRLKTTTQAEDIVSSMLADLGIEHFIWMRKKMWRRFL